MLPRQIWKVWVPRFPGNAPKFVNTFLETYLGSQILFWADQVCGPRVFLISY